MPLWPHSPLLSLLALPSFAWKISEKKCWIVFFFLFLFKCWIHMELKIPGRNVHCFLKLPVFFLGSFIGAFEKRTICLYYNHQSIVFLCWLPLLILSTCGWGVLFKFYLPFLSLKVLSGKKLPGSISCVPASVLNLTGVKMCGMAFYYISITVVSILRRSQEIHLYPE